MKTADRTSFPARLAGGSLVTAGDAAAAVNTTGGNTIAAATANCNANVQAAINANAAALANMARTTFQQMNPQPANLSSSTCFSNILNMGQNIGLSFFNPATLIQQLQQMVCNAAQQAVQWPLQQAQNVTGQINNSTGGLAQVNMGSNGGSMGSSSVNFNGTAPGPALNVPSLNTGNALNNILG